MHHSDKINSKNCYMNITDSLRKRILILDGAMGTMIQSYNLTEDDFRGNLELLKMITYKGNNDMLNITRPDVIADIHRRYLKAGADIIETNTFSSQRVSQSDYHLQQFAREMALRGARIARQCADEYSTAEKPRYVAGSIGPTNKTLSMSPDVSDPAKRDLTYDELFADYFEQAAALIEGGVDTLLIETIFDTLNAKAAIDACQSASAEAGREVPIMLSVTVNDLAGRTLSGQTLAGFLASVSSYQLLSVGLNCSLGAPQMLPFMRELATKAPYFTSVYPNAGLPNELGQYDETAETMAEQMAEYVKEGLVNIMGGCCGTTDEFIARYVPIVEGRTPRHPALPYDHMTLSGLDVHEVLPHDPKSGDLPTFNNVGERCNVAGSRKFLRLINEKQYEEALTIARKQVDDGAMVIDINMDDGLLDAKSEMVNFLNMIAAEPDIARVPVMIDSSKWDVITAGLKCVQGKCIVNSISLKNGEAEFISHAKDILRYGAAVVVMCFDEQGQATTYERKIEIAERAYHILVDEVGLRPYDIIFDPNILSIATGIPEHDNYAVDFIRATEWIRSNLPGAHVSGGVSNLSFSFRGNNYIREAMHAVFLYHAIRHGMDFGIVNPATKVAYADIPKAELEVIEDVVLNRSNHLAEPGSWSKAQGGALDDSTIESPQEKLISLAADIAARKAAAKAQGHGDTSGTPTAKTDEWRTAPVEQRLMYALRKGLSEHLADDLKEALNKYGHAVDIIGGPLMDGMNEVGRLFGEGKMFLPQVVKTARTMKQAVEVLKPYMEAEKDSNVVTAGTVLLATVKGDVHDIGKNIVGVVMACNNYKVIDLGVMVPPEQIVETAKREHVDMIGLSGLITPSLDEMVNVATELNRAGITTPLMVGGATTSELHAALKIAPVYGGLVLWIKDAAQEPLAAAKLMDPVQEKELASELSAKYERLRQEYHKKQQAILSLDEARRRKPDLFN